MEYRPEGHKPTQDYYYSVRWNSNVYSIRKLDTAKYVWVCMFKANGFGGSLTGKILPFEQVLKYGYDHAKSVKYRRYFGQIQVHKSFLDMFTYWVEQEAKGEVTFK